MRLLKLDESGEFSLTGDLGEDIPSYGILSHTWGADHEEVTFEDLKHGQSEKHAVPNAVKSKVGYGKIRFCAQRAKRDGLDYFWVDTCCINKADLVELQEAINSMFRWYRESTECYVYLADVSSRKRDCDGESQSAWESSLHRSRWFTRGWTLQELLAPRSLQFFSRDGDLLGSRDSMGALVHQITGIPVTALQGAPPSDFDIRERMRWVASRSTKKPEDMVYCLLGIFDVSMSLIYGEGEEKALKRLKDEICKQQRSHLEEITLSLVRSSTFARDHRTVESPHDNGNTSSLDRRGSLMESLSFDRMSSRRTNIKNAHAKTCSWFLQHAAYIDWNDPAKLNQHRGFLWVKGKPGVGKSTLMKFAHSSARKTQSRNDMLLSFFFNARGDSLEKSVIGMYRSLLHQLLDKATDLQDVFDEVDLPPAADTTPSAWTVEILRELFAAAVGRLPNKQRLRCYIDALDECNERDVQNMIVYFENLGEVSGNRLHICFASRHYPTIVVRNGLELTLEHEPGHGEDVIRYVQSHLAIKNKALSDELEQRVPEKANGVFMWAVLVVDILNNEVRRGRIFNVSRRLDEIPVELSDLFKDILRRDSADMDELLLCLQWILFAKRPLTSREFYHAMLVGLVPASETIDEDRIRVETDDDVINFVHNCSKGLAEVTAPAKLTKRGKGRQSSPTVQFIHESVRDFLLKEGGLYELWPGLKLVDAESLSHEKLKCCCQKYLTLQLGDRFPSHETLPRVRSDDANEMRVKLNFVFPFLRYAVDHVLHHANEAAKAISQVDFIDGFACKDWVCRFNMLCEQGRHGIDVSLLYLLAEDNLGRLILAMPDIDLTKRDRHERHQFALIVAIYKGCYEAVQAMLEKTKVRDTDRLTQSMRLKRKPYLKNKDQSLLGWAVIEGYELLVEGLVKRHSRLIGSEFEIVLMKAASSGWQHTLHQLISRATTEVLSRALYAAVEYGQKEVIETLFAAGVPLEKGSTTTALSKAALQGRCDVMELLIASGADVDGFPTSDSGDQAMGLPLLLEAAVDGHLEAVDILLFHGAQVSMTDSHCDTALSHAAQLGRVNVAELLLDRNASPNMANIYGATPLSWAAWKGHADVVALLLSRGAKVNEFVDCNDGLEKPFDGCWMAPLRLAVEENHEVVVSRLFKDPVDVRALHKDGTTAMFAAIKYKHAVMAKMLQDKTKQLYGDGEELRSSLRYDLECISHRCQENSALYERFQWAFANRLDDIVSVMLELDNGWVNARSSLKITPLMLAASHGRVDILQALLSYGADIDARDETDNTALIYACRAGHVDIVHLLLEGGAAVNAQPSALIKWSPLHCVAASSSDRGHSTEILELLIDHGADVNDVNCNGEKAIDIAIQWRNFDKVQPLLERGAQLHNFSAYVKGLSTTSEGRSIVDLVRQHRENVVVSSVDSAHGTVDTELSNAEKNEVPTAADLHPAICNPLQTSDGV